MLKKTALSCAASAFTAVPGRDCHRQPSSHNPATPTPHANHYLFPLNNTQTPLKLISNFSHHALTCIPITIHLCSNKCPISYPQLFPQPHPPPFPYIPESFSQCLFVIHPLRSQILISSIFL
ncbi:TPA: hypothetical protein MH573_24135 [Klebsiella pneumoniae]|nr:hypothetical protein [Klebsiella pneumoniae]HBX5794990.1 hypothetical protein [Klebsiella pneumoniae]HBX6055790.1 hypothetical protein [Klebsiella pneumoniae]